MLVKDVLNQSATLLGKDALASYIDGGFRTGSNDVKSNCSAMLNVLNMLMNEIASTYLPLVFEMTLGSGVTTAYFNSFRYTPLEITDVRDINGNSLPFSAYPTCVKIPEGTRTIVYTYLPPTLLNSDSIPYNENDLPLSVIVYGVCAEYCVYENRFEEAVMWNKKFTAGLEKCMKDKKEREKPLKNRTVKTRSFI